MHWISTVQTIMSLRMVSQQNLTVRLIFHFQFQHGYIQKMGLRNNSFLVFTKIMPLQMVPQSGLVVIIINLLIGILLQLSHSSSTYAINKWHHVVLTIGSDRNGVLYVNGSSAVPLSGVFNSGGLDMFSIAVDYDSSGGTAGNLSSIF